ncbi:MAG TPA: hypothetical protein VIH28_07340 [Ignavibacteriaceae bacterium]
MLRFFNIILIAVYFFCGYVQLTEYQYSNSLKDKIFKTAKNSNPARSIYITTSLPKHILNVNHNVLLDCLQDDHISFSNVNRSVAFFCTTFDTKPVKLLSILPFNKAPPLA